MRSMPNATVRWAPARACTRGAIPANTATHSAIGTQASPAGRRETERNALWTGITLVMSEPGFNPEVPADERAELQRRSQIELAMLPAAKYPRLVECAAPMTACDDPEFHYRFGIGLFIDGIKAAARS